MEHRTIKLPHNFIKKLVNLPENGMGYQIVSVILRSGKILSSHKVLNSELLMLEGDEKIVANDIERIGLENN
jgi:hypothetical protein